VRSPMTALSRSTISGASGTRRCVCSWVQIGLGSDRQPPLDQVHVLDQQVAQLTRTQASLGQHELHRCRSVVAGGEKDSLLGGLEDWMRSRPPPAAVNGLASVAGSRPWRMPK
jgi:hypothetical protein